jgi:hypothetical protein
MPIMSSPFQLSDTPSIEELTNRISSNYIQGAMRLKSDEKIDSPLRPARTSDGFTIQKIAREIAQNNISAQHIILTTGFGIHRSLQIPVRLPALLLPALRIMERFHEVGLPVPTYIAYQATEFISETNEFQLKETKKCAEQMEAYLRGYIDRFHTKIAANVILRFNEPYSEAIRTDIEETIGIIRECIGEHAHLREMLQKLQICEQKHSNGTNKFGNYAAANALYSGAIGGYPFADDLPTNLKAILPIGGNAEKPFFAITPVLADRSGATVIPLLTPLGARPTYYPYPALGDPTSIDDYKNMAKAPLKDGPLRTDFAALHADGATPDALADIYPSSSSL